MAASALSNLGAKPPSSPTGGGEALFLQHGFEGVKGLGDGLQAARESGQALGHDHEFLEINGRVGMSAAVDDVGHRHGQDFGVGAAEVFEQRQAQTSAAAALALASETARMALAPSLDLVSVPSSSSMMRSTVN